MGADFGERLADLAKKSDEPISDDMMEILRLKRIAEQTQKMFDAQKNADTPVSVALQQNTVSVELSPRDVGEMYELIRLMALPVDGWGARNNMLAAQGFIERISKQSKSRKEDRYHATIFRIRDLAEKIFGDKDKAERWMLKPKDRFVGRTPMEMMQTEDGADRVEEMLMQLDNGFTA